MNVLIIKTGAMGDVLRTSVILEGLIEKYVSTRIYWLTSKNAKALLDNNPFIEKLFFKEDPIQEYTKYEYDLVISLEEDMQLLESLRNVKKKTLFGVYINDEGRITYTSRSAMWYDKSLQSRFGKSVADELKKANLFSYPELLYKALDLDWKRQRYRVFLTKKDLTYSRVLKDTLAKNNLVIGVVVGSGGRWPMKVLPVDKQIELIQLLNKTFNEKGAKKVSILLLTGNNTLELENTQLIKKKCPYTITHDVQDVDEFIGIVNICDIIITPDTLSMHIGIALNKHVITYFTVTSAAEIELYTGTKIIPKHHDYCTYTQESRSRPNITDSISITNIVSAIEKLINKNL